MARLQSVVFFAILNLSLIAGAGAQQYVPTERHKLTVTTITDGLNSPWGMVFISANELLVTEKSGTLKRVSLTNGATSLVTGVPTVAARGQGGLLDITLDPNFSENQIIYISYAEADPKDARKNGTAVARAKLQESRLTEVEVIFRAAPKYNSGAHFGSRLAFSNEGHLYITLGDRYSAMADAQVLHNHHGKLIRIWPDGSIPEDNPFLNQADALPEIFSYGHRNVQGAAVHPQTGALWISEHGPQGGDEINIIAAGHNYGWPLATYGIDYDGSIISEQTHVEGTTQPIYYWVPSIAVSNIFFYSGDKFPHWQGDLFIAALKGAHISRLDLEGDKVLHEESLLRGAINRRIRDIAEGPDGYIYLITDESNGHLMQIRPAD